MRWEKENWIKEVAGTAGVMFENLLDRQWEDEGEDKEETKLMRRKRMGRRARISIGGSEAKLGGGEVYDSSSESSLDEDEENEGENQEFLNPHVSLLVLMMCQCPVRKLTLCRHVQIGPTTLHDSSRLLPPEPALHTGYPHLRLSTKRPSPVMAIRSCERDLSLRSVRALSVRRRLARGAHHRSR